MKKTLFMILVSVALSLAITAAPQKKDVKKAVDTPTAAVKVINSKFEPKELRVKAGTTVTWTLEEGTHTVISDEKTFTSETLTKGKSFSHQFTKPGKYLYHCSFHGAAGGKNMAGTIIVTK